MLAKMVLEVPIQAVSGLHKFCEDHDVRIVTAEFAHPARTRTTLTDDESCARDLMYTRLRLKQVEAEIKRLVAANEHWHVRVVALNSTNDQLTESLEQAEARIALLSEALRGIELHALHGGDDAGRHRINIAAVALAALNEPGK